MKYLGPTEASALSCSKSLRLLWRDVDTKVIEQVLIPFNPTNSHWILIYLKVITKEVTVLDPLHCNIMPNNFSHNKSIAVAKDLFRLKFDILNPTVISAPSHCLQKDSYNCGVYICYYALQFCEEKNINDPFNEVQFRKYIYDTLCGRCLKNLESGFERLYDICRICKNTSSKKNDWVQCTKCPQWYHCECAHISIKDADVSDTFQCQ
ncbi:uncharacterized protein LOC136077118 [Hydra vulgaris]|uniref:Uncharacterized protein LOC136077118 n=1 Tax=Hydra vulgaris TaxID=6087 RepID=A0ABM4BFS6_HYDVU